MKTKDQDKAWISNYPPLRDWIARMRDDHNMFCQWQYPLAKTGAYIELWQVRNHQILILVYPNRGGWAIFTQKDTNLVAETFADVERRIGLEPDAKFAGPSFAEQLRSEQQALEERISRLIEVVTSSTARLLDKDTAPCDRTIHVNTLIITCGQLKERLGASDLLRMLIRLEEEWREET